MPRFPASASGAFSSPVMRPSTSRRGCLRWSSGSSPRDRWRRCSSFPRTCPGCPPRSTGSTTRSSCRPTSGNGDAGTERRGMNRISRRELLRASVGAAAAAAACRRTPSVRFDGELLGQNAARGHRLRDGFRPPPVRRERVGVAILGGGVSGLSAAWRLRRRGFTDFTVLELEDHAGGTSRSGENGVTPFPWGAHYVPAPLDAARDLAELLREMGVVEGVDAEGLPVIGEQHLCRAPQERLFFGGAWG